MIVPKVMSNGPKLTVKYLAYGKLTDIELHLR